MLTPQPPPPVSTRTFVLVPTGPPPAPAGPSFRRGWLRREPTDVVVSEHGGNYSLGVTVAGQRPMELSLPPPLGEALLAATAPAQVRLAVAEWEHWTIRVYEEALWGLILGDVELAPGAPAPRVPPSWRLGREVTGHGRFQDRSLARLTPEAARLVVEIATRLV